MPEFSSRREVEQAVDLVGHRVAELQEEITDLGFVPPVGGELLGDLEERQGEAVGRVVVAVGVGLDVPSAAATTARARSSASRRASEIPWAAMGSLK